MEIPDKFYRVTAKALVRDGEGKLLLLREPGGKWVLPGGGVEFNEDPRESVRRELAEECGFVAASVSDAPVKVWTGSKENREGVTYWNLFLGYEVALASLEFTPSREAEGFAFVGKEEAEALDLGPLLRAALPVIF